MRNLFNRAILIVVLMPEFLIAQQSQRLTAGWEFLRQDIGGIWEAVRPVSRGGPEELPAWSAVVLPHCVNASDAVDPDKPYYQGPAWYRNQLSINNPYPNGRTYLHFEGAGQKTTVYLYTTKVGEHEGGYDEFSVDITDALAEFNNNKEYAKRFGGLVPIEIRTDNSRDIESIPSDLSDFNRYGGLYRYLNLVYQPGISLSELRLQAEVDPSGQRGTIRVTAGLHAGQLSAPGQLQLEISDNTGKLVLTQTTAIGAGQQQVEINPLFIKKPLLWSTDHPLRYQASLLYQIGNVTYRETISFGFRTIEFVKKGPFLLNGKRLLLRGTHRHEDHAGVGAALTEAMMREEMLLMKAMGVNFIRLGHYQQSRIILNLCDSLGILVWEEIPWCRGGIGGSHYQEMARHMLRNMINQHYHHPSIIIWGLGNENDWPGDFADFDKGKIRAFMQELNALSHQLDPGRKTAIRRCDFCKDIVDVYSPSIWAGWYRGIYTEYRTAAEAANEAVDHFLHVEWGGDSHAGRHSENPDKALQAVEAGAGTDERLGDASLVGGAARVSKDGDWSESYMVNLFDWHLKEQEKMPWLTGSAAWIFKDFSTPIRPDNPIPYMNQKGVVERDLTPKESYYVFQSYWSDSLMAHIYGHSWPVRWGKEGEEKWVKVYSNATEAELVVNGKSYGIRKRNSQDFPAAGLRWKVVFRAGNNTISVRARRGHAVVTDTLIQQYQTAAWGKPATLQLTLTNADNGFRILQVQAMDEAGIPCLDAAGFIRFGITGSGRLIDNLGTAGGSRRVQLRNGRASIRIATNNGESVASVTLDKLPAAFIHL